MSVRPNHSRNRIAEYLMIVMTIYLGMQALGAFGLFVASSGLFDFLAEYRLMRQVENTAIPVAVCYSILQAAFISLIGLWMARSLRNLNGIGVKTNFGPFSAGISWFVPVANLWMPFQVVKQIIYSHSKLIRLFGQHRNQGVEQEAEIQRVASIWWGFWIITLPMSFGFGVFFMNIMDGMLGWDKWAIFLAISIKIGFDFFLGILTIRLIRKIRVLEDEVYALWDSGIIQRYAVEKRMEYQQSLSDEEAAHITDWFKPETNTETHSPEDLFVP